MTIGIVLSNESELESVVITDSRMSGNGRQSDSVNKIGEFNSAAYHGAIFGSGVSNYIEGIIKNLKRINAGTLDEYVNTVQQTIRNIQDREDKVYIDAVKRIIQQKGLFNPQSIQLDSIMRRAEAFPASERSRYIYEQMEAEKKPWAESLDAETRQAKQNFEQSVSNRATDFVLTAYDCRCNKTRKFFIDRNRATEIFLNHHEIGSGSDGANFYFSTNMQGKNLDKSMPTADLILHAVNAYNYSTVNHGVGGTPNILIIGENGNVRFSDEQKKALVNLSGAYLARFADGELTKQKTREYVGRIMANDPAVYDELSKTLDLTKTSLTGSIIAYGQWQERAN